MRYDIRGQRTSMGLLGLVVPFLFSLSACGSDDGSSGPEGTGAAYGSGGNVGTGATPGNGGNGTGNGGANGNGGTGSGNGGNGSGNGGSANGGTGNGGGIGNGGTGSGNAGSANGGTANGGSSQGTGGTVVPVDRVDNPFVNGKGYVNPEWKARATAEPGGSKVADTPTAVWLDRIAAINGTPSSQSNGPMGLRAHLDAAVSQGATYAQFVIYDLPGRDCSALASNGELGPTDLSRYKSEYIDPIAAIEGDAKYAGINIINIIEPDSLPNLVTNTSVQKCADMKSNGGYVQGVGYAVQKLGAFKNVYNYLDAGHHGWLGWDNNFGPTAQLFADTVKPAGFQTVAGFITNTANYSALHEEFFDSNTQVGGQPVKSAKFLDWNPYVDELSYATALRDKLVSVGFDSKIGMLIDTSRNGWGGAARPKAKSSSTDVNTFVNESRLDRRIHPGNWCNQSGAGLGERPKASPSAGIDAYVWIKPPGESDGSSTMIQNNDGKGFDRMCDPTYTGNERNGNSMTGALGNAPLSGTWFSAQFQELVKNAYPAL